MATRSIRTAGFGLVASLLVVGSANTWSFGKDDPAAKPSAKPAAKVETGKPDPAAEMEAWMKSNQPGDEHKKLATFAGEWEATVTGFMPDGTKTESKGMEKSTIVLGGRFIESKFEGTMMGMKYAGRGLMGYDNAKKKYIMTWTDSMSTGIMLMEGNMAGKVLTMTAESKDAAGNVEKLKAVTTVIDENHHTFDMYMIMPDGKEMKTMSIDYKRVVK